MHHAIFPAEGAALKQGINQLPRDRDAKMTLFANQ
jgi:hypothetical protein